MGWYYITLTGMRHLMQDAEHKQPVTRREHDIPGTNMIDNDLDLVLIAVPCGITSNNDARRRRTAHYLPINVSMHHYDEVQS